MSVEIASLGKLAPSQPLDFSKYPTQTAKSDKPKFVMPPSGEYTLMLPQVLTTENFRTSQAGALTFKFNATIVGGPHSGTEVKYISLSAKTYERDGVEQSMLGNLVAAAGGAEFPGVGEDGDPTPQVRAVEAIAGKTFVAYLNWEAEDRKFGTGLKVKGMKNFPTITLADGSTVHQSFIPIDGQTDAQGRDARVWANLYISNFVTPARS
jgi:hypothetical protein